MRQVWIRRRGGPEVLEVREAPDPDPGPGEVRIRVAAAGVNFADIMARMGLYPDAPRLPAVVGYEVAGTVEATGPGVQGLVPGQRAAAFTRFGGYSDAVVIPVQLAFPIPDALSTEEAAALPVNYLTAWLMLVRLGCVRAGDRVLVHSAAGGVGQAALQICLWRGASVIGTAGPEKHERLRALGVACCIDSRGGDVLAAVRRETGGHGVDLALDGIGGASPRTSYACLAPLGRLFLYGVSALAPGKRRSLLAAVSGLVRMPAFRPVRLMNENRGVIGLNVGRLWDRAEVLREELARIIDLAGDGVFRPVVDRVFPFERAADAHLYIQDRKNFGKVLLRP